MVKVFTPNKAGKIEFTKTELENLLNEVWLDGYNANRYYWTSPTGTAAANGHTTWAATSNDVDLTGPDVNTHYVTVKLGDP